MDSITQAVLGAAIGYEVLGENNRKKGAVIGAVIATLPDLDILLFPFYSSLDRLSVHRGLSHSILFTVLGTWIVAWILSKVKWTSNISYLRLACISFLCLFTHIILDAFTAYGTLLLMPFSDRRIGVDSINVVDPVYTGPLLLGLFFSFWLRPPYRKLSLNRLGLIISSTYLLATVFIKSNIKGSFESTLNKSDVTYSTSMTQPVGIASLKWYCVAQSKEGIYIGNYSLLDSNKITFEFFPYNDHLLKDIDPYLVDRMRWFAKGNYHVVAEDATVYFYNLQVDMQGIHQLVNRKAPTKGYFTIYKDEFDAYILGSGRH